MLQEDHKEHGENVESEKEKHDRELEELRREVEEEEDYIFKMNYFYPGYADMHSVSRRKKLALKKGMTMSEYCQMERRHKEWYRKWKEEHPGEKPPKRKKKKKGAQNGQTSNSNRDTKDTGDIH